MRELGISDTGPRALVQKRHTEWLNLWNASCDSRNPRPKRELLAELDVWERTQGGKALDRSINKDGQSVMSKDFDGADWSRGHDDDFKRLIETARRKKAANLHATPMNGNDTGMATEDAGRAERTVSPEADVIDITAEDSVAAVEAQMPMKQSASRSFGVEDIAA